MASRYGDYQLEIYLNGLNGVVPSRPMTFSGLAERAEQALSPSLWSYVAGGAGDERTQDANASAFGQWGPAANRPAPAQWRVGHRGLTGEVRASVR